MLHGHHWGMHWLWWIFWAVLIFWIFALPYDIPGRRKSKEEAIDILKRRLAQGEISENEFDLLKKKLAE